MSPNHFSSPLDQDAERKRALAKVYSILLRIAEEHESTNVNQNEERLPSSLIPTSRTTSGTDEE